jgi:hypothetical protein
LGYTGDMQVVLRNQVESFERTAAELQTGAALGGWGNYRSEVEALMATLVAQFRVAGEVVWRLQDSSMPSSAAELAQIHSLYGRLMRTFDEVLTYGRAVERAGHVVAGKAEFLDVWRELKGIVAMDPDRAMGALDRLRQGQGIPLGELVDEISRDPRA